MTALLEGREHVSSPNLRSFLRHSEPALARLADPRGPRALDQLSQGNVLLQLEHLRTYPMVAREEAAGRLRLHAFWFDIAQAEVLAWEAAAGAFVPLDEEHAERMLQGR
jgi:carbonic anhydrase